MKAYFLSIKDDGLDQGGFIVFANTAQEARKQAGSKDLQYDRWIDIQAHRDKKYDNLENLPDAQLALRQWKDGWQWIDHDEPDTDVTSDEEFIKWYEARF